MHTARLIFIVIGLVVLFISLLPLGFAVLGLLGMLADVGPDENRQMGLTLLGYGLPIAFTGIALIVIGLVGFSKPNHTKRSG